MPSGESLVHTKYIEHDKKIHNTFYAVTVYICNTQNEGSACTNAERKKRE